MHLAALQKPPVSYYNKKNNKMNEMHNNIIDITTSDLCTGCGTCKNICQKKAITFSINKKTGLYIPNVNEDFCVKCKLCLQVCPGWGTDYQKLELEIFNHPRNDDIVGRYLDLYSGYSNDYETRFNSSSGGIVTQILMFALELGLITGALVTKMNDKNPLRPEPFIARTKEDLIEAAKSKYCPVPANLALDKILHSDKNEKFAVVGLPCHINGIRKFEHLNPDLKNKIVMHIGLFCANTLSFCATENLLENLKIKKDTIKKIDYRGNGWPGGMTIHFTNKEMIYIPKNIYYDSCFSSFIPNRCTLCNDHTCELADISIGDAWLPKFIDDNIGQSIIIARSEKAQIFLFNATNDNVIEIKKVSLDELKKSQDFFILKKRRIYAQILLLKILNKPIPKYILVKKTLRLEDICYSLWVTFWINITYKKNLWKFLMLKKQIKLILDNHPKLLLKILRIKK